MAWSFDQWEKDPFFNAAEEVHESADRVESTYRTWLHATKDASNPWNIDELRRDLHTVLGTAKWQLDEFQRAVKLSYRKSINDDARNMHQDFIVAIDDKISKIEHLLQHQESGPLASKASKPWVSLDEGERNELASFISGMPSIGSEKTLKCTSRDGENPQLNYKDQLTNCSRNLYDSSGWGISRSMEEKPNGHRKVASADADISSWKIAVSHDLQQSSSSYDYSSPMQKVASLSGFFSSVKSVSKLKWPKNGYRELKSADYHQEPNNALLPSSELNGGINACRERGKSCLQGCDECCDKQLHRWYGAFQRQLQRSQYQMQYNRPVQITIWIVIILCFIVLIAFCTM